MADVQVGGGAGGGALGLGLSVGVGHAQLPRLGERLEVVRRHRPELEVRLVAKEPVGGGSRERQVATTTAAQSPSHETKPRHQADHATLLFSLPDHDGEDLTLRPNNNPAFAHLHKTDPEAVCAHFSARRQIGSIECTGHGTLNTDGADAASSAPFPRIPCC